MWVRVTLSPWRGWGSGAVLEERGNGAGGCAGVLKEGTVPRSQCPAPCRWTQEFSQQSVTSQQYIKAVIYETLDHLIADNWPCCSLLRLARMGRHSLRHMDVVPMAVVGVHSVGVWRWTLVCSSAGRWRFGFIPGVLSVTTMQTHTEGGRNNGSSHVGCCIILRLWTSILCSISCWWSLCTEAPSAGIWWGRLWWSVGKCCANGALELDRWWVDREGAGVTAWPEGCDGSGGWKVTLWGMT